MPNIKFRILNSEQDIPQSVIDDLAADGIKPSQMQAAVGKDGVVYIRADKVPPSEVEHVLTHETIGHIGLENFMGGKFVAFLDEVYDQHFQEMDEIRRLYKLGGQKDSPQTRRKITREWLAELAAKSADTRPDFWTRITAQLRVLLHKLGFKSYWSDRDLTALFIADRKQLVTATPELLRENISEANAPMAESTEFSLEEAPWEKDFPKVTPHTNLETLRKHADYKNAKAGDRPSAAKVVADIVKTDRIIQLAKAHPNAIILPVRAEEASGRNALPIMYAEYIGIIAGLEVDEDIIQSVRAHHTDKDAWYRITHPAEFDGQVKAGREYIIVDDVITMGGTINALRNYIIRNGGKVVDVTTLSYSKGSTILSISPKTLAQLRAKFGNDLDKLLYEAGIATSADAITESEGQYLKKLSPDTLRDRCIETGLERRTRGSEEDIQGDGHHAPSGLHGQVTQDGISRTHSTPSLSSKYSSADSHDFIAVLKTAVGTRASKADSIEKWQNFCKEHHLNIDAEDIMAFVTEERDANRLDAWQERTNAIEDYIIETDEIFHGLSQTSVLP